MLEDNNAPKDPKTEILVGNNYFNIYYKTELKKQADLDYSPEWASRPYSFKADMVYDPSGFPRHTNEIGLITNNDIDKEIIHNYSMKSIMSLDAVFSPISFYPTPYASTFHISKYPTPCCPFCNGTKSYKYKLNNDNLQLTMGGINSLDDQQTEYTRPCPFCELVADKEKQVLHSASARESSPPYIIASGEDLEIISTLTTSGASGMPIINYGTLNPFILSSGEFGNFQNKQSGDLTGFSVDMVAYGMMVPRSGDGLRPFYSENIYSAFSDKDVTIEKWIENMKSKNISIPPLPPSGRKNNVRSFALRGPIMLHSWGYDLDGFPVPNASGEPLIENGLVVRDTGNNIVGKNQKRILGANGQIEWSKPYKENTFYKGWGQSPGSWPVGPIDFRWDSYAKVWTVGSNYKPVYVLLEEDLVNEQPIRGSVIDSALSNEPLPSGLRKLVFVKDQIGNFSAPRGAVVYCRYDSQNGFYEPVARSAYVTSGTIKSQNMVEIYKIYTPLPKPLNNLNLSNPPVVETYQTLYTNPLQYPIAIGDMGLFTFLGSGWILQSYRYK
jgi:hypothetical protein